MGDRSEPPRKVDLSKWDATWERIRANQARQRAEAEAEAEAEAAAAELRAASSDNETEGEETRDGLQAR